MTTCREWAKVKTDLCKDDLLALDDPVEEPDGGQDAEHGHPPPQDEEYLVYEWSVIN